MCERRKDEAVLVWAFRQFCEKPMAFFVFLLMGAIAFLVWDSTTYRDKMTEVLRENTEQMAKLTEAIHSISYN